MGRKWQQCRRESGDPGKLGEVQLHAGEALVKIVRMCECCCKGGETLKMVCGRNLFQEEVEVRLQGEEEDPWLPGGLRVREEVEDLVMSGKEKEQTESDLPPRCHTM